MKTVEDAINAINQMQVRGAPLIGITAVYGVYLGLITSNVSIEILVKKLAATRPTAINLQWALSRMMEELKMVGETPPDSYRDMVLQFANNLVEEDVKTCYEIGQHGLPLIKEISNKKKGETVNILTHCNAGWLGCVEWGTATSPIYQAHEAGIKVHVWVDETRPRNQGFNLTAWELGQAGIPHTLIVDNAGGHLMQHGMVDMVIVGTDRTTRTGDVANKIGTYLKALAAFDNYIPFYVALPTSTIDWNLTDGISQIPIEERNADEVKHMTGWDGTTLKTLQIAPENSPASNFGFDVTPAKLVTSFITEKGICEGNEEGLKALL